MEIACGVLALTLVLLAGALLGATRRRKELSELVEELRSLFQPRSLIERARIGRNTRLETTQAGSRGTRNGYCVTDFRPTFANL